MKKVKIIDNTNTPNVKTKEMIGGVFDVRSIDYYLNTIGVYNKGHSDYWYFYPSDVQEVCGDATFNGEPICVGDEVNRDEVYDWYVYDGEVRLLVGLESDSLYRIANQITSHTPKLSKKIETITIRYYSCDKKQVEEALRGIKAIK